MFTITMQLVLKLINFVITIMLVLHVIIVASATITRENKFISKLQLQFVIVVCSGGKKKENEHLPTYH